MRQNLKAMVRTSTALLFVLFILMVSPLSVTVLPSRDEGGPQLVTLDVCHKAGAAFSVNTDAPAIQERPCRLCSLQCLGYLGIPNPSYKPSLLSLKEDRPPEA
ncbi:MAG: hypothetical protein AB1805_03835 [Nitrospirota bacterium]